MSIFSEDIVCGRLSDVVKATHVMYPSGKMIQSIVNAAEANDMNSNPLWENIPFGINIPEIDHESQWLMSYDGFNCNRGEIFYSAFFKQSFVDSLYEKYNHTSPNMEYLYRIGVDSIADAALCGKIDTAFKPRWTSTRETEFEISQDQYWDMVAGSIEEGIRECIDDKCRVCVSVRRIGFSYNNFNKFRGQFIITCQFLYHEGYGYLWWPNENVDRCRPIYMNLYRGMSQYVTTDLYENSNPPSVSLLVDFEYVRK